MVKRRSFFGHDGSGLLTISKSATGSPNTKRTVIGGRDKNTWVDGIPCDTVNCARMAGQFSDGIIAQDVVDVDLVVLTTAGHEAAIVAAETAMDGVEALGDTGETADHALLFHAPQVNSLQSKIISWFSWIGKLFLAANFLAYLCCNIEQGVAVRIVQGESHDAVSLLKDATVCLLLFEVIGTDPMVSVSRQDELSILSVRQSLYSYTLLVVKDSPLGVTLVKLSSIATTGNFATIGGPGHSSEAVLGRVGNFAL
jgi:hypothetical protein